MVALAAPSAATLLRPAPDPALAIVVVLLGVGYALLLRARHARHPDQPWPVGRTWAFGLGVAALALATQSGIARYDTALFSIHVLQHLLIGMVAPLLLALGAPVTLALQGSTRSGQVALLSILDHPIVRVMSHPLVAWSLFSLSLFVVYTTPLFGLALRNGPVHAALHLHFLAAGFLFCWSVVGVDVGRRRVSHAARLLAVALTIPFHAILGLLIQAGADSPLGAEEYGSVVRTWGGSLTSDQQTGASLLWGLGELWGVVLVLVVAADWMKVDARRQAREDARLDAEAEARSQAGPREPD